MLPDGNTAALADQAEAALNAEALAGIAFTQMVRKGAPVAYGGFTYTKETHKADIGPLHMSIAEKEHVNVPVWAGGGARSRRRSLSSEAGERGGQR